MIFQPKSQRILKNFTRMSCRSFWVDILRYLMASFNMLLQIFKKFLDKCSWTLCVCVCSVPLLWFSFSGNPIILLAYLQYLSLLLIPSLLFISLNFLKKQVIRNNFKFIIESIQR